MERTEAKRLGLTFYNTGRPCKNGHTDDRRTSTCTCTGCEKDHLYLYPNSVRSKYEGKYNTKYKQSLIQRGLLPANNPPKQIKKWNFIDKIRQIWI